MKILHGSVRSAVRVKVDDANATPENSMGYQHVTKAEHVEHFGFFQEHGDATFSVDPDGTLYICGDPSKPAHHSYGRNAWLWVGDENNNSVFNCAHDEARPDAEGNDRVPQRLYDIADGAASHEHQPS